MVKAENIYGVTMCPVNDFLFLANGAMLGGESKAALVTRCGSGGKREEVALWHHKYLFI